MLQKTKLPYTRLFAFQLAVFVAIGALFSSVKPVHAADGTIDFHAGPSIAYGDYFTSRMTFDGSNTAYCVEPLKRTPPSGTYSYDLLEKTSPLRKALRGTMESTSISRISSIDICNSQMSDNISIVIAPALEIFLLCYGIISVAAI